MAFKGKRETYTKLLNFRVKVRARSRTPQKLGFYRKIVRFGLLG